MSTSVNRVFSVDLGLNPCCNGIYSMRLSHLNITYIVVRLNPCCNGIYSMRKPEWCAQEEIQRVLILVVMEYTQ